MVSVAAAPAARRARAPRLVPAEGWAIVLLHAVVVLTAAWTIDRADLVIDLPVLVALAAGGAVFGLLLAKARVADLLAHFLAMLAGAAAVVWIASDLVDGDRGGRRERLRLLWSQAERWYDQTLRGNAAEDVVLFAVVMGITLWLVAYTSAWVLYRRGWLPTAVVLPGIVVVINLGYSSDGGTTPLLVFVIAACVLAARHYAFRREREWSRAGVPSAPNLPGRFLRSGVTLAVVVALLGWTVPLSARSSAVDAAWDRLGAPMETVERWWERWLGDLGGADGGDRGAYNAFGESFSLGGPLDLGDQPVLRLEGTEGTYLAAHRYDFYTGHGWKSDVEHTFDPYNDAGQRYSPQMTFRPEQKVPLSGNVSEGRESVTGRITVLRPQDDLLFTLGSYVTSDQPTSVQLSWRSLDDEVYRLDGQLTELPTDLRPFAALLRSAQFSLDGAEAGGAPQALDPSDQDRIARERRALAQRFLATSWDVGPDGAATTLYVSGQIPVYDDVEAVFGEERFAQGAVYEVTGEVSTASPNLLRAAGDDYPAYVRDRYLQQPTTVSAATAALAEELSQGLDNPFDIALAIQNHLRERIVYDERIDAPPDDRDVVDYVLFESRRGYCEYYASAMAVMLRTLDIPARMVAGYAPARQVDEQGAFVYLERNAHAWVEVFFPGYGWIPFEPTPAQPPIDYGDDVGSANPAPMPTPEPEPTPIATAAPAAAAEPTAAPAPMPAVSDDQSPLDRVPEPLAWASALTGLALLVGLLALAVVWSWGLRGLSPAGSLYARVVKAGRWMGVRSDTAMTPTQYAERLGRIVPAAREPARAVADLYVVERYGARPPTEASTQTGRAAWRRLRRVLLRSRLSGSWRRHERRARRG